MSLIITTMPQCGAPKAAGCYLLWNLHNNGDYFTMEVYVETIVKKPDPNSSKNYFYDWYVKRRIGSIGLLCNRAGDAWLGIKKLKKEQRTESIKRLMEKDQIKEDHQQFTNISSV